MKTNLYNQSGEIVSEIELPNKIFGLALNPDLILQVLEVLRANARQVIAHTKGRGEVRGGGKKPWRQKGTGRARHASIRSPIWKGGGVTFGPTKERNFTKKINVQMRRKALLMALSSKFKDEELMILEDLSLASPKTREAVKILKTVTPQIKNFRANKKMADSILLVTPEKDRELERAFNNLPNLTVITAKDLNPRIVLEKKFLIIIRDAIPMIEKNFKV
jgi:large subunit ribosomal protein L4